MLALPNVVHSIVNLRLDLITLIHEGLDELIFGNFAVLEAFSVQFVENLLNSRQLVLLLLCVELCALFFVIKCLKFVPCDVPISVEVNVFRENPGQLVHRKPSLFVFVDHSRTVHPVS